jgi:hypothetical protein
MKLYIASSLLLAFGSDQTVAFTSPAFTSPATTKLSFHRVGGLQQIPTSHLYSLQTPVEQRAAVGEVERLRSMAQKLRVEAAALKAASTSVIMSL